MTEPVRDRRPSPPRPHLPHRPIWLCQVCGFPWPCGEARLALRAEYAADRPGLAVYLCGLLHEAVADLHRLNPHELPSPQALFDRFVSWTRQPQQYGTCPHQQR